MMNRHVKVMRYILLGVALSFLALGCSADNRLNGEVGENPVAKIDFEFTSLTLEEGTSYTISLSASQSLSQEVEFSWSVVGGADDFSPFYGFLTLPSGNRLVTLDLLSVDDSDYEGTESFQLEVFGESLSENISLPLVMTDNDIIPTSFSCPANFTKVPALNGYTSNDICVAKYEAKSSALSIAFQAAGQPLTLISRLGAEDLCQSLGAHYDLVSNSEWQALARDIENVDWNWSGAAIAVGALNRGYSDSSFTLAQPAAVDTDPCYPNSSNCDLSTWHDQRRVHKTSLGEYFWDLSGNVSEWVAGSGDVSGVNDYHTLLSDVDIQRLYGPAGDYGSFTSSPYGGLGAVLAQANKGAIYRSGYWSWGGVYSESVAGVFTAGFDEHPAEAMGVMGFRCSYDPLRMRFNSVIDQVPGSTVTTETLTAEHSSGAMAVSVSGDGDPQLVIDGSLAGQSSTLAPGDSLAVRLTAPVSYNSTAEVLLSIEGKNTKFTVQTLASSDCPAGYIPVPGNTDYSVSDFCVAKYEMKDESGSPISKRSGAPWVYMSQLDAATACGSLGAGYDLISNNEWQTLARNIESVAWNWSGGAVGSGALNQGRAFNNLAGAVDAASDSNPCFKRSMLSDACDLNNWHSVRRVHQLSNGHYVWDLAGNVSEWVKNEPVVNHSINKYIYDITDAAVKQKYGPAGDYTSMSSNPYGGLGYAVLDSAGGGIYRGGAWLAGSRSGIFLAGQDVAETDNTLDVLGFRCVYRP